MARGMTLLPGSLFYFLIITVLIVGTIGNLLTLLVLQRKAYTGKSFAIILRALAVADTVALWIEPDAIIHYSHTNFPTPVGWTFWGWFIDWVYIASSWTIILVTIERLIGIYNPYKAKIWITQRRAIFAVVIMWVTLGVIIASYVFAFCVEANSKSGFCISGQKQKGFIKRIMFMVLYSVLPSAILILCNILIIIKLQAASSQRQEMSTAVSAAAQDEDTITIMLMTNSFVFAIFTVPYSICSCLILMTEGKRHYGPYKLFYEVTDFCHILERINHAINFALYCVSGGMFRREMKLMLKVAISRLSPVRLCQSSRASRSQMETQFMS